jgi:RHS repeat-associated protein
VREATATGVSRFGYDTNNLRVFLQDGQGSRRVLLDTIEELAEYDANAGALIARYDHETNRDDGLLGQILGGAKNYFISDALGSTYGLVGQSGAEQAAYSYEVFGSRTSRFENSTTPWGFVGRRQTAAAASPLHYRAREYDPALGQFLGPDPLGLSEGPNLYTYVNDDPTDATDPTGLRVQLFAQPIQSAGEGRGSMSKLILGGPTFYHAVHTYIRISCDGPFCGDLAPGFRVPFDYRLELGGPINPNGTATAQKNPFSHEPWWTFFKKSGMIFPQHTEVGVINAELPTYDFCGKEACVANAFNAMSKALPKYDWSGPNSNTFSFEILHSCHMFPDMPWGAIGWDYYYGRK